MPTLCLQDEKYDGSRVLLNFLHFKEHGLGSDSALFLSLVSVAEERQNLKSTQMELFHWPYFGINIHQGLQT